MALEANNTEHEVLIQQLGIDDRDARTWPPALASLVSTADEMNRARLSPDCIIENMLYADLGLMSGAGGAGKTTLFFFMAVHIVLGLRLFGNAIKRSGRVLFITAEDSREICLGRTRRIMDAMNLTDEQRQKVREDLLVIDIVGEERPLIGVEEGNLKLTGMADSITDAYRDESIALIGFDPLVAFGASENMVNDNEQKLVTAFRRISRALNVCILAIHHTGQNSARAKMTDAYAGRGGTALPDGSRMVLVLHPWEKGDKGNNPPSTLTITPDSHVLVLNQPKLSYARKPVPIWIVRNGFLFEGVKEPANIHDPEVEAAACADQLERFLISELKSNRCYTQSQIENGGLQRLDMTRAVFRQAIMDLEVSGRVLHEPLPKNEQRGSRKSYLHPAAFGKNSGEVTEK